MNAITVIPTPLAMACQAARANPRNADTCGLYDVAGRLGQADRGPAYLVRTIDALIAHDDFPSPFPIVRAGGLLRTSHRDSRWPRAAVDLWFDNRLPPAARGLIEGAERVEIDSRLSANAATLFTGNAA